MADVAVKRAPEQKSNEESAVARREQGGLARQGLWDPFSSWSPAEFFSNPFAVMRRMSEEMDRNFGGFFGSEGGQSFWSPAIEVSETGGQLRVHAELPGLKPEDVKVEVLNDQLVIRGERKSEQEENRRGVYR